MNDELARAIEHLAEAMTSLAEEIKDFRRSLRDEWLKVNVQGQVTDEGRIRYDTKNR